MLSSRGRVRTPDPRPAVRHEPAQDPLVQARRDPPAAPARRATELEVPPLSRVGQDRLFERPQAASRQRPRVDLLLRLARRSERRVGPQSALLPHAAPLRSSSRAPKASSSGSTGSGTCHIAPHEGHSKESSEPRALRRQHAGRSTSCRTSSPRGAIQIRTTRPSRRGG